jgi:hypothetical protein
LLPGVPSTDVVSFNVNRKYHQQPIRGKLKLLMNSSSLLMGRVNVKIKAKKESKSFIFFITLPRMI